MDLTTSTFDEHWVNPEEETELPPEEPRESPIVPYDPLQRYLAEINRHRLLTPDEEKALLLRYHQDQDPDAAYRLITSNLRLVVKIAMEFQEILDAKPAGPDSGRQHRAYAGHQEI